MLTSSFFDHQLKVAFLFHLFCYRCIDNYGYSITVNQTAHVNLNISIKLIICFSYITNYSYNLTRQCLILLFVCSLPPTYYHKHWQFTILFPQYYCRDNCKDKMNPENMKDTMNVEENLFPVENEEEDDLLYVIYSTSLKGVFLAK